MQTFLVACRKSFCVAAVILLQRFQKMRCNFRGRRSTLYVSIVIWRGRRSTLESPLQFSVKVAPPDSVSTKLGPDPQTGVPIITKSKVPDLSKHGYHYKIKTEHVFLQSS